MPSPSPLTVDQARTLQTDILTWERSAATRAFSPAVLPGPLQTPALAHALCSRAPLYSTPELVEAAVELRLERYHALLEGGPHRTYIITPLALSTSILPRQDMAAQLDRLDVVAALAHVDLRVLPADAPVPWTTGFVLRAGHTTVEGPSGTLPVPDTATGAFEELFGRLLDASLPYAAGLV